MNGNLNGQCRGKCKTLDKYLKYPESRYWSGHLRGLSLSRLTHADIFPCSSSLPSHYDFLSSFFRSDRIVSAVSSLRNDIQQRRIRSNARILYIHIAFFCYTRFIRCNIVRLFFFCNSLLRIMSFIIRYSNISINIYENKLVGIGIETEFWIFLFNHSIKIYILGLQKNAIKNNSKK